MAGTGQKAVGAARRPSREQSQRQAHAYVDGNTVRKAQAMPRGTTVREHPEVSRTTRVNREKALRMNMSYVVFLTAAAVLTVFVCINYLKLQAQYVSNQKTVTAMSSELSSLKLENDSMYNRIVSSVDLEQLKKVAMEEYGMVFASDRQIRLYDGADRDYVRQFQEIPTE